MASVICETPLDAAPETAWALLQDPGAAARAFPGVLIASSLQDDVRTVTFSDGNIVRERIVTIDEAPHRIAYTVIEGRFTHHSASMRIIPDGPDRCRFLWISDFLPAAAEAVVRPLMQQGCAAFKRAAEGGR